MCKFLDNLFSSSICFGLTEPLFKIESRSLRDPLRLSNKRVDLGSVVNGAEPNRRIKVIAFVEGRNLKLSDFIY